MGRFEDSKEGGEENMEASKSAEDDLPGEEERDMYLYEGEFIDGFKHGIGRLYFPNGSYFYCEWAFNLKVSEVIFYNSVDHNYSIFKYRLPNQIPDHFSPPPD